MYPLFYKVKVQIDMKVHFLPLTFLVKQIYLGNFGFYQKVLKKYKLQYKPNTSLLPCNVQFSVGFQYSIMASCLPYIIIPCVTFLLWSLPILVLEWIKSSVSPTQLWWVPYCLNKNRCFIKLYTSNGKKNDLNRIRLLILLSILFRNFTRVFLWYSEHKR